MTLLDALLQGAGCVFIAVMYCKWHKANRAHETEMRNIARDMAAERHAFERILTRAEILLHNHLD